MKKVTITITPELFDNTVKRLEELKKELGRCYTCNCLVANGINVAFPDRKVEGLSQRSGWFADSPNGFDFQLDDRGEAVIRAFDQNSTRNGLRAELPISFELTLLHE